MGYDGEKSDTLAALCRCAEMTGERMRAELSALEHREAATFGEQIYKKRKIGGVRAEAASGFASVRESGLPRLRAALDAGLSLNDAGLCALVALMGGTQDTNAIRRGGEAAAAALQEKALDLQRQIEAALQAGTIGAEMKEIRSRMQQWDALLSAEGISPGGCADLLAMTLLACFMDRI